MPHSTHPSSAGAAIRPATFADIDEMVVVHKAAGPLDQGFPYVYQHAQQYSEDLIKFLKLVYNLSISPKYSDFHVMVAEAPSLEDGTVTKVIAFAVWDVSHRNKRQYGSEYESQSAKADVTAQMGGVSARRVVNPERSCASREAEAEASKRLFDDVYGADNVLELVSLKAHPDYMRRGFGSALEKWGINVAKKEHLASVSVLSSRTGTLLYTHLGFKYLEQLVIQAPEETETLTLDLLALEL